MQTATILHQLAPDDIKTMLLEVLRQAGGTTAHPDAIPVDELPPFSAAQAAKYLRCSPAHLATLVGRYPHILKPITTDGQATKYDPKQLLQLKSKNLVK